MRFDKYEKKKKKEEKKKQASPKIEGKKKRHFVIKMRQQKRDALYLMKDAPNVSRVPSRLVR